MKILHSSIKYVENVFIFKGLKWFIKYAIKTQKKCLKYKSLKNTKLEILKCYTDAFLKVHKTYEYKYKLFPNPNSISDFINRNLNFFANTFTRFPAFDRIEFLVKAVSKNGLRETSINYFHVITSIYYFFLN